ncbi:hypothetical protein ILUMI_09485 [Ignelater luminosus]|uniref:Reverse transcriptase/retrotransposon-derived protein RNase H-like domain-containing protein n=1 Tax=Ignelater luminosus TaxID=2038154 RepID=A0A8K0D4Z2_IGNLU|nr:hypothetical protein ILUMI_09485 [Ignelater luminosus]
MNGYRGLAPMDMSGDLHEKWKFWKQKFNTYLKATEICKNQKKHNARIQTRVGGNFINESEAMARTSIVPPQVQSQHQDIRVSRLDSGIKKVVENQFRYRKCDADSDSPPVLGLQTCLEMNLIQRIDVVKSNNNNMLLGYDHLFRVVGCIQKAYHIKLKPHAKPVVHSPRKILLPLMEKFKICLQETGIKFNNSKLTYMGHQITVNGLSPDDSKIKAILEMPSPTNRKELQRELLRKDIAWYWNKDKQKAIDYLKTILTSKPVLQYYDVNKPCILSADASKDGLAAVLLQNKMPCAYVSKAMTGAQKRYAQIEKEFLAILFACEHFHQYIYRGLIYKRDKLIIPLNCRPDLLTKLQCGHFGVNKTKNRARLYMYLVLLHYRNSPIEEINVSPAQLLMGRTLRDTLPINESLLIPRTPNKNLVKDALRKRQESQRYYYNRGTKPSNPLKQRQKIYAKTQLKDKEWRPATIENRKKKDKIIYV